MRHRQERRGEELRLASAQVAGKRFGQGPTRTLAKIGWHRGKGSSEEVVDDFIERYCDPMGRENVGKARTAEHLAVDEDTIAIEDHQIAVEHCRFRRA
jgi:hypothetical protein